MALSVADLEGMREELARRKLLMFACYTDQRYEPAVFHANIATEIDDVIDGRTKRLMLFMPPQHGKTELASRKASALKLGKDPDAHVVAWTYNSARALEIGRDVQRVIAGAEYQRLFPGTRLARGNDIEPRTAARFGVVGHRGSYTAAGVGEGITGKSMDLGIIDDPHKGREEAESDAMRRRVWNSYTGDFETRQRGFQSAIIGIGTRWHTQDLWGKLLELAAANPSVPELQWRVVVYMAQQEGRSPNDPRRPGQALWPERFPANWLEAMRITKGTYDFESLYQQRPVPPGGAMAQRHWFKILPPRSGAILKVRAWDLAGTKPTVSGQDPDWTVGTLMALHSDLTVQVEHVVRVRETPRNVDALMLQCANMDGRQTLIREYQDPGQAGKSQVENHRLMLAGWNYDAKPASGEKTLRWRPFLSQAEGGNVSLVEGAWNRLWLDEAVTVPYGTHDDQMDSGTLGHDTLMLHKPKGPSIAVIHVGAPATASGQDPNRWREEYFRR